MKKSLSKIAIVCAACSMLAASSWAQQSTSETKPMTDQNSPSSVSGDQNNRSWSTKHLTATGRNNDTAVRASRLVGAQVNDLNGQRAGQIQDIILNPVLGRIDFALLSLGTTAAPQSSTYGNTSTAAPGSTGKLVPVPWSLLRTSASSAQYSTTTEQPVFTFNADQSKLTSAPTVDWSNLSQSEWRQRIYSYYGVTPQSSMGGAESPEGEIKGEGAWKLQQGQPGQPAATPESQPQQPTQPPANQ